MIKVNYIGWRRSSGQKLRDWDCINGGSNCRWEGNLQRTLPAAKIPAVAHMALDVCIDDEVDILREREAVRRFTVRRG